MNKTESAVRITHLPTGIVVSCQNERSQHQNREMAMKLLKAKLAEEQRRQRAKKLDQIKGEQTEIAWGNQIRSYVFCPYTLVKDHRTGKEIGNIQAVMDGEIDPFIEAFYARRITRPISGGKWMLGGAPTPGWQRCAPLRKQVMNMERVAQKRSDTDCRR